MPLKLTQATPHDAPRIANIHMQAFQTNALLHAQFPTPAAREGLRTTLAQRVIDEIKAPSWTILVAKRKRACDNINSSEESQLEGEGEGEGEVVGFAKWHRSESKSESESESDGDGPESDPPWIWPEGARIAVLDRWGERVDAAARRVLGKRGTTYSSRGRPCYHLSFVATDPRHQRLGAGSMLVNWGLERCKRENAIALLESTMEAAPFYEKLGFCAEETISMRLDEVGEGGRGEDYEEVCFAFWP